MTKAGYIVRTSADVALTASTAKTILACITPSSFGGDLQKIRVSFDGVTSTNPPVLCELCYSTNATNSTPGTNNTSETVRQVRGRIITPGFTAFSASTSEPTVLTVIDSWKITPVGGTLFYDIPLGTTIDWDVSAAMVLRMTPGASITGNARASFDVERA